MTKRSQSLSEAPAAGNGQVSPASVAAISEYLTKVKAHPPGSIALTVGELGRYHAFTMSLASLEYPPGTRIHMAQSLSIAANLNIIVGDMSKEADWLWCQADDHVFLPDTLLRMLHRLYSEELDVLVPIMCRRRPPFSPLVFKEETEDGYMAYAYNELPTEGLLGPLYAAGTGGMLIRRSVIERVREWQGHDRIFENSAGEIINEDTEFCRKLRALDIAVYADCEVTMGHCTMLIAWPHTTTDDNQWGIQFQMGEGPEGALKGIFLKPGEAPPGS